MIAAKIDTYRFTEDDHFDAEREGFIKQINSFELLDSHRSFGRYDFRDGVYGEIAFAAWSGIERRPAVQGELTDGGYDFLDLEATIDVKATAAQGTWPAGRAHLMRSVGYNLRADFYALVVLNENRTKARFAGWAPKAELATADVRKPGDTDRPRVYVPTRVLSERDLHHDWRGWNG